MREPGTDGQLEVILHSKTAPVGGTILIAVGLALMAGGIYGAFVSGDVLSDALVLGVGASVFGLGLMGAGRLLVRPKGGLLADERGRALHFRGGRPGDTFRLSYDDVERVRLVPRDEEWGREAVRNWSCELVRTAGCTVAVAESRDYDNIWTLARRLEDRLGRPLDTLGSWAPAAPESTPARSESAPDTVSCAKLDKAGALVQPRRFGSMQRTLLAVGLVAALIGGALMSQVAQAPIFGFLFGPTLLFLGLAFLGVTVVSRFGYDEIAWDGDEIRRRSRLGPIAWGVRTLPRERRPYLRLHPRGLIGSSLELVGPARTLVLVGGVCSRSALGHQGLLALGDRLVSELALKTTTPEAPEMATPDVID